MDCSAVYHYKNIFIVLHCPVLVYSKPIKACTTRQNSAAFETGYSSCNPTSHLEYRLSRLKVSKRQLNKYLLVYIINLNVFLIFLVASIARAVLETHFTVKVVFLNIISFSRRKPMRVP